MKYYVLLVLACALWLTSCKQDGIIPLDEVSALISEEGYSNEDFMQALAGRNREDIVDTWGEPNASLSGLFGDIWMIREDLWVALYYDRDGTVTDVIAGTPELGED